MHWIKKSIIIFVLLNWANSYALVQNNGTENEVNKEYLLSENSNEIYFDNQSIEQMNQSKSNFLNKLISLHMVDANLGAIIKSIAKENKLNFIYEDRLLNIKGIIVNYDSVPLYKILDEILTEHNINYYEFAPGEIALAKQSKIDETTGGIKGNIKDEKGEKLFGANIFIRELGIGSMSDVGGNFWIKKIKPGEYTLEVSYVGYEKITRRIKISAGIQLELNFTMKETSFLIGGIEVVATSDLLPRDVNTKTNISSGEIEHFQASSIKDVLDLVPGVQKTDNPGLGKTSQVALRGNDDDNSSTFGTLVLVDGSPVSNNANMQFEKATSSIMGVSNLRGSVDLRLIPADNIQNIEVITGLPSVKYGDATSGVINIKTKIGATPNRIKFKNNPDTKEANFEGGLKLGEGSLSYNLNAAQSSRDIRVTGDEYVRLTGQLVYSNRFFDNALTLNNKISFQRVLDEQEPRGDLLQTKNYNRGYTLGYSTWGNYDYDDGISTWNYNFYVNMRNENSMKSKLVTDYVILPSGDTLNSYIGRVETKGVEWTVGGRFEYSSAFYTGNIIHKFLAGIEPQYNANTGEGLILDTLLNYYGQGSGKRSYSYDAIPGQLILGMYLEDKISGHLLFDFNLMLGMRYEMYRPTKFNLSGLWGDGDLVESRQGTFFNPRMNLMIYFSKYNQLRLSLGTSSKSPPMSMIYPPEDVTPWRNPFDKKNYFFRIDMWQPNLKGYREAMAEVSYDHKLFDAVGITATAYFKTRSNNPVASTVPIFFIAPTSANKYKAFYIDYYSKNENTGQTETKGLEFSLRTSKIESLNMDFTVTGSYTFIKFPGVGFSFSSTPDATKGQFPNNKLQTAQVDTSIGWFYSRGDKWNDRLQINYALKYTLPALGLWITLRAEQLLFERSQTYDHAPIDFNIANKSVIANYLFAEELKTKPNKWLFSFNMSKSLFKGAEVSFYVNNFFDDPAIRRYYNNPTDQIDEKRNPDLFYGIEFSMIFDSFNK